MGDLPRATFPILAIEPSPDIPDGSWRYDAARSRRGRELAVYVVRSTTDPDAEYEVVHNHDEERAYCTCPARVICKHLRGVAYWTEYRIVIEWFRAMGQAERERRRADHAAIDRGELVATRWHRVERDALARVLAEKQVA